VSPFVELDLEGACAKLTLTRPDKLNALDRLMIDALIEAARAIEAAPKARVAILSGECKAFCAGGQIAEWSGFPPLEMRRDCGLGTALGWSGAQRLVRRFGPSVVRRMALTGAMFSAEEGLSLGLVGEVGRDGEGLSRGAASLAHLTASAGAVGSFRRILPTAAASKAIQRRKGIARPRPPLKELAAAEPSMRA
jgi:enoyl-CoA hydratase